MMTSIDLSSSSKKRNQTSFSTSNTALQPTSHHLSSPSYGGSFTRHHHTNHPIGTNHPSHPSSSLSHSSFNASSSHSRQLQPPSTPSTKEAGRFKTEQVMMECFYKLVELILQSRIHLLLIDHHQERRNRRARFNLDMEELPHIREEMNPWKEDIYLPLFIEITGQDIKTKEVILLEQWSVVYSPTTGLGPSGDVMQQLKDVVKKISVLLRALHSFLRQLPAHRVVKSHYPSSLSYTFNTSSSFEENVSISRYSFIPIQTPFGFLKVSTIYRRDCSLLAIKEKEEEGFIPQRTTSMLQDNVIIQDYVPASPEQVSIRSSPSSASSSGRLRTIEEPPSPTRGKSYREGMMIQPMSPRVQGDRYSLYDPVYPHPRMEERPIPIAPVTERRGSKLLSQPMAIPHQIKPAAAPTPFEEDGMEEIQHASMMKGNPMHPIRPLHPHSYADPEQLRAIGTNPNITAAPYGYGNAVIESPSRSSTAAIATVASGLSSTSASGTSPLPLSTPPRHPHSMLTPRTTSGRLLVSSGKNQASSSSQSSSLENFILDGRGGITSTTTPSPTLSHSLGRTSHHSLQFTDQSSSSVSKQSIGTSPQLTPPFMAMDSPSSTIPPRAPLPSAALVLRSSHSTSTADRNLWIFSSSPPFQANPTELLSTSPGYAFSKKYRAPVIQRRHTFGTNRTPTALVPSNNKSRGALESSELYKTRTFSADVYENSVGRWGISPDSPDTFELAIASTRREGTRGVCRSEEEEDEEEALETSEMDMMMLPFAIGDVDSIATTTSSEGTRHEQETILSSWDTASVGSFLQQLKAAPRLSLEKQVDQALKGVKHRPPSLYDTELQQFRQLRDTLTQS